MPPVAQPIKSSEVAPEENVVTRGSFGEVRSNSAIAGFRVRLKTCWFKQSNNHARVQTTSTNQ